MACLRSTNRHAPDRRTAALGSDEAGELSEQRPNTTVRTRVDTDVVEAAADVLHQPTRRERAGCAVGRCVATASFGPSGHGLVTDVAYGALRDPWVVSAAMMGGCL